MSVPTADAPLTSGKKISSAAMSKVIVVIARTRSADVIPGASPIAARRLARAACGMDTPLGLPVEPLVKMT